VEASSFTPTELGWPSTWVDRAGHDRRPVVPGHEVSGTVVELGYGTTGLSRGDEVFGMTDWYRDGAAAEYVAVEARNLGEKPVSIPHAEAASLPLAGLTAWQALFVHAGLQAGQAVIVAGAGGGVGTLAVQLARQAGAHVIAAARPPALQLVTELGAERFADLEDPEMAAGIGPVDVVFDLVGAEAVARCSPALRSGGILVSAVEPPEPIAAAAGGYRGVFFVVEPDRDQLAELARRVDAGRLRPVIGQSVGLRAGAEAFAAKGRGGMPGKVVFTSDP
jgi:NADPH:quinone reductase-like Zn-dependent oxidoreductase